MKVALVTGANRGLGYGIVQKLAHELRSVNSLVYLTSRNNQSGEKAAKQLVDSGLKNVAFHKLDIDCELSRNDLIKYLKSSHPSGINIWVNNAGVYPKTNVNIAQQASMNCRTNYFSTVKMMTEAVPLMASNSNIVNISGIVGLWTLKNLSPQHYQQLMDIKTLKELDLYVHEYIEFAKNGTLAKEGWPSSAYGFSKMCQVKATKILSVQLRPDPRKVIVTSCCPGYVKTEMNDWKGTLSTELGVLTPYLCATTRDFHFHGEFINDRKIVPWSQSSKEKIVTKI